MFTGEEGITLDVNTGSYGIVTRDASGIVTGNGGTTTVRMRGDIEAWGERDGYMGLSQIITQCFLTHCLNCAN